MSQFVPKYPKLTEINAHLIPSGGNLCYFEEAILLRLYDKIPDRSLSTLKLFIYYMTNSRKGGWAVSESELLRRLNMKKSAYYTAKKNLKDIGVVKYEAEQIVVDFAALFPPQGTDAAIMPPATQQDDEELDKDAFF